MYLSLLCQPQLWDGCLWRDHAGASWGAWAILAAIAVAVPVYGGVLLAVGGMGKDDLESLPFIGHRLLAAGQKLGYFR